MCIVSGIVGHQLNTRAWAEVAMPSYASFSRTWPCTTQHAPICALCGRNSRALRVSPMVCPSRTVSRVEVHLRANGRRAVFGCGAASCVRAPKRGVPTSRCSVALESWPRIALWCSPRVAGECAGTRGARVWLPSWHSLRKAPPRTPAGEGASGTGWWCSWQADVPCCSALQWRGPVGRALHHSRTGLSSGGVVILRFMGPE